MQPGQGIVQDRHEEHGGAARDVAGALGDGIRGDHAGSRVSLGRAQGDAGLQGSRRVDESRAGGGERPRVLSGAQHGRQEVTQPPRHPVGNQLLVRLDHGAVVGERRRVDGEHSGGVTHAENRPAGELVVDPTGQGGQAGDLANPILTIQDPLVKVGDGPAQGNIEGEQARELVCGASRVGVAPRSEGRNLAVVGIEGKVAVHHRRNADAAVGGGGRSVAFTHVGDERGVGVAQPVAHLIQGVGPQPVTQLVLPRVAAGGQHLVVGADEDSFDPGGSKLNAERGVGGCDGGAGVGGHGFSLGHH